MPAFRPRSDLETHAVENQPPERGDLDLWAGRPRAARGGGRAGGASGRAAGARRLRRRGRTSEAMRAAGRLANRHPPELRALRPRRAAARRGGRSIPPITS